MADDGSDEEDPWFDRVTNPDAEDTGPSESGDDSEDQSVQSTDQWEWVRPSDSRAGDALDGSDDKRRVWDDFEDSGDPADRPESGPGPEPRRDTDPSPETEPDDDSEATGETSTATESEVSTEAGTDTGTDSGTGTPETPTNTRNATPPSPPPTPDGAAGGADVPPPPPADGESGETEAPPGPTRRTVRDLQPLYRRRSREFYLLWLVAALAYGLGDMLTTSVVFVTPLVGESNPFVAMVLDQFGLVGFVAIKLAIFAVLVTISVKGAIDDERLSYYGPPLLAILIGTVLTVWNLTIVLGL